MVSALLRARELRASVRPNRTGYGSFVRCNKSSDFLGPGEQARNAVTPDVRVAPLTTRAHTSLGTGWIGSGSIVRFSQLRTGSDGGRPDPMIAELACGSGLPVVQQAASHLRRMRADRLL